MIVRDRPSGLRLFFVLKGSILSRIWIVLLVNIVLAILVTILHGDLFSIKITLTAIPFTLLGLPLAIFLGFRNNAAYDRYWEARKLWGQLLADARTMARQCTHLIQAPNPPATPSGSNDDPVDRPKRMILKTIAFAHALKHQLRGTQMDTELDGLLSASERTRFADHPTPTVFLLDELGADLGQCIQEKRIDPCLAANIDTTLSGMVSVAAGCERIKNTPIPFSYTLLLHRTAYLYCFLLPFGLVDSIGFMTPFVVAVVAYTFFGLDALGDEIEEPFGLKDNDLPLDALSRTIEYNLRTALGERNLPAPPLPEQYCLM